jgi:hypothetical protein
MYDMSFAMQNEPLEERLTMTKPITKLKNAYKNRLLKFHFENQKFSI